MSTDTEILNKPYALRPLIQSCGMTWHIPIWYNSTVYCTEEIINQSCTRQLCLPDHFVTCRGIPLPSLIFSNLEGKPLISSTSSSRSVGTLDGKSVE